MKCSVCLDPMRFKKEIGSRIGNKITCRSDGCKQINKVRFQYELKMMLNEDVG